jgi:hypothetical protein
MAIVLGPNGAKTYVPDDVAASLVGDGSRGYAYAQPAEPSPAPAAPKRAPRKRAQARKTEG